MEAKLTFSKTERYSVPQFIKMTGNTQLDVVRSPKTNKPFMAGDAGKALGGVSDAVAKAIEAEEPFTPLVSLVTTPENVSFYLMHMQGEGGKNTLGSFGADGVFRAKS